MIHQWVGSVELHRDDGTYLGEAFADLHRRRGCKDRECRWWGILRAPVRPSSVPWPRNEPVVLEGIDGKDLRVMLTPDVIDRGPIFLQIANVLEIEEPS